MFDEFRQAFQRYNNSHIQMIIINVVVFVALGTLWVFFKISGFENTFDVIHKQFQIPASLPEFLSRPWTLITYMFTHDLGNFLHILFNMLVLYWFGRLFVEYLGSDKLVAVYILGGLAGATFYLLAYNTIPYFATMAPYVGMVGASAAVDAIVVGTATLLPNYTFYLLFFGPVRIKYIAAITVFLSFLGTVGDNAGGNLAHLGGALIGFVYMRQLQAGSDWGKWITVTLDWFKNIFKAKPKVKVSYRNDKGAASFSSMKKSDKNYTQDEIDAILDKISAAGYESLTKEEKEKLFNASKNK
jgi:membrane associated rhomboid family serine protease